MKKMPMASNREITDCIESIAPLHYQEEWDNSGYQLGDPSEQCTGVMVCVDATEDIVSEAAAKGCNLIIAHHPLMFRGVKQILGRNRVERVIAHALRLGVTIYSCHTSIDNAPNGVSWSMANMLGAHPVKILSPSHDGVTGCGIVADLDSGMTAGQLVELAKASFGSPVARCSCPPPADMTIKRVAMCGGAGSDFIPQAIALGAQAYITSDTKLNFFLDHCDDIFIIDLGHYETEECTKELFCRAITEKFPNFAVYYPENETNPIHYL